MNYILHLGNECPVPPDTRVAVRLVGGGRDDGRAGDLYWGPGLGPGGEGRIKSYLPIDDVADTPIMSATVAAFNASTGLMLTASQGHLLLDIHGAVSRYSR